MKTILLKQGDIEYQLGGGLGSWAKSFERYRVEVGTVRLIDSILMSAYTVYPKWTVYEINWSPIDEKFNTFENLRSWKTR